MAQKSFSEKRKVKKNDKWESLILVQDKRFFGRNISGIQITKRIFITAFKKK